MPAAPGSPPLNNHAPADTGHPAYPANTPQSPIRSKSSTPDPGPQSRFYLLKLFPVPLALSPAPALSSVVASPAHPSTKTTPAPPAVDSPLHSLLPHCPDSFVPAFLLVVVQTLDTLPGFEYFLSAAVLLPPASRWVAPPVTVPPDPPPAHPPAPVLNTSVPPKPGFE